jgi:hypothetical protein
LKGRKLLAITSFFFLLPGLTYSLQLEWIRKSSDKEVTKADFLDLQKIMDSLNKEFQIQPKKYFLLEDGDLKFLLPDNYSYVFKWNGQKFQNLYGGLFHGYNEDAFKWIYNDKVYSYGGWVEHSFFSEVIFFEEEFKQWELVGWLGDKPHPVFHQPIFIFNQGDQLLGLFDIQKNVYPPHMEKFTLYKKNLFEYDQKNRVWKANKRVQTTNLPDDISGYINLADYLIFWVSTTSSVYLLEKNTLAFKQLENTNSIFARSHTWDSISYVVTQNQIQFYENGLLSSPFFMDTEFQQLDGIQYLNSRKYIIVFLFLISLGIPLYIIFAKRGQIHKRKENFPYPQLFDYKGKVISQEQLDICLGVSKEVSESSRRNRRSKILKTLNSDQTFVKVERIRNELDSRVFSYKIT